MTKHVPSIVTLLNLSCGFAAIAFVDLYISSILILTCIGLDAMDGLLARLLNAQSELGKELDSLADLVSFGIAPAYLYFTLAPTAHWIMVLAPLLLIWGSALRLAKFNTAPSSKYFTGLPTPATAFFLTGIFLANHYEENFIANCLEHASIYLLIPAFLMFMMLSRLQMFSLKEIDQGFSSNHYQILTLLFFITLLVVEPKVAITLSVIIYITLSALKHLRYRNH